MLVELSTATSPAPAPAGSATVAMIALLAPSMTKIAWRGSRGDVHGVSDLIDSYRLDLACHRHCPDNRIRRAVDHVERRAGPDVESVGGRIHGCSIGRCAQRDERGCITGAGGDRARCDWGNERGNCARSDDQQGQPAAAP